MNFPQYLWRIRNGYGWFEIRRGNTPNEPLDKFFAKDLEWYEKLPIGAGTWGFPVGIEGYCGINDARAYSQKHDWDWLNS